MPGRRIRVVNPKHFFFLSLFGTSFLSSCGKKFFVRIHKRKEREREKKMSTERRYSSSVFTSSSSLPRDEEEETLIVLVDPFGDVGVRSGEKKSLKKKKRKNLIIVRNEEEEKKSEEDNHSSSEQTTGVLSLFFDEKDESVKKKKKTKKSKRTRWDLVTTTTTTNKKKKIDEDEDEKQNERPKCTLPPGILDALGRNDGEEKRARGEIRRTWRVLRRGGPHREDGVWKRPGGERRSGREHVPVRLSSGRLALDAVEQRRHERRRDSRVG